MLRMSLDVIPYGGLSMHFLRDSSFLEDYITEGCYAEERFPNCRSLIVLAFVLEVICYMGIGKMRQIKQFTLRSYYDRSNEKRIDIIPRMEYN